jgi:hypothetical protein
MRTAFKNVTVLLRVQNDVTRIAATRDDVLL